MARTTDTDPGEPQLEVPTEHADVPMHPPLDEPIPAQPRLPNPGVVDETWEMTPDYVQVFGDDFRPGTGLLIRNWWTRYIFSGGMLDFLNDEWQRYREDGNHVRTARGLSLTGLRHNGHFWPSGMIRSKDTFPINDGRDWYFESRAKCPGGKGVWPAIWLAADQKPADLGNWDRYPMWPPEIDIMEVVNNENEDRIYMLHTNAHVRDWTNNPQRFQRLAAIEGFNHAHNWWWAPFSFADDFHVFALHYKSPQCTWYCDNKLIFRANYEWVNDDRSLSGPAHLLLNFAIGGSGWAGRHGVDNDAFPQSFDIDYVKVFNRQAPLQRSVIGHDLLQETDEPGPGPGPGPDLGPSEDEVRAAMIEALNKLQALLPFPDGSNLDPKLVAGVNNAVAELNNGLGK